MVEDTARVPPREFARALAELDRAELAAFVGALWAPESEEVAVDPPVVTVRRRGDRFRLLAGPSSSDDATEHDGHAIDGVITAADTTDTGEDVRSIGPTELRQRLLYEIDPETADRICEQHLGIPARAASYGPGSSGVPSQRTGSEEDVDAGSGLGWLPAVESSDDDSGSMGRAASLALAVTAVLVLLAGGAGAVYLAELGVDQDTPDGVAPGGETPVNDDQPEFDRWAAEDIATTTATPTATPRGNTPVGVVADDEAYGDPETDGATRYASLEPTCNRSYLHVVQIQMNALKYNDNTTNDGIRTVRRFASPRNREAVGSFDRFLEVVKSPPYEPMLSYDSVTYRPRRMETDVATVEVVTRAEGNVTGKYAFRVRKQESGEYDGCWMTDGVQSTTDAGTDG